MIGTLYYDDISLTASRAKRNKLGMFYFTLGNFNATFRSRVDTISLLAVAQYEDIRSYGVDRVLTLLCELETLDVSSITSTPVPLSKKKNPIYYSNKNFWPLKEEISYCLTFPTVRKDRIII